MNKEKTKNASFFFAIFQKVQQTYYNITREKFEVTDEWFEQLFQKHYSNEFKAKYNPDLYLEQGIGDEILNLISIEIKKKNIFLNEVRILEEWLVGFLKDYKNLKVVLKQEKIEINERSKLHLQLELLKDRSQEIKFTLGTYRSAFEPLNLVLIETLAPLNSDKLKTPAHYQQQSSINNGGDKYIDRDPDNRYTLEIVFRRLSEVIIQIQSINRLIKSFKNHVYIIHGSAGMGKSNLSAHLSQQIKAKGLGIILLKAKSFSGESTDLEKLFLKNLEVPDNYRLSEVLNKLNLYGISKNQKITIIIDGLNETTLTSQGFSNIWKDNLDHFIHQINLYSNLVFIASLRTSYLDRIWPDMISYSIKELTGFTSQNLREIVSKYFHHYKISAPELKDSDIFYFRTPLLLDLYCQMLNPKPVMEVDALLGLFGFKQVFVNYIDKLAKEIKLELNLVSANKIIDGLERCSDGFINNQQAYIDLEAFYDCFDGPNIQDFRKTVGFKVLEGYVLYLQDSFNQRDVILHTQQEVGGFLLSRRLLQKFNTIEEIVKSDFFNNQLIGPVATQHQLKDDILKFLIVESEERGDLITSYSQDKALKKLVWLKLQREPISKGNIKYRDSLVKGFSSKSDVEIVLNNCRNALLEQNSTLNIFFVKEFIIKLQNFDFDLTWSKLVYEYSDIFVEFIDDFRVNALDPLQIKEINYQTALDLELAIWLLETTIINVRDKATHILLEYGSIYPKFLFDKLIEFSSTNRLYIYERLAGICYGVCLRNQNDEYFIQGIFKEYVPRIYELQFSKEPHAPSFHYIVIDSLKHIIDLAIHKEVFSPGRIEEIRLVKYKFHPIPNWIEISDADLDIVSGIVSNWHNHAPDPLGKDFVTYTIPRLLKQVLVDGSQDHLIATANIFKRAVQNGYISEDDFKFENDSEKSFYYGANPRYINGKIDRLGKKYAWNALFEYAGYLLNKGELDIWYDGDNITKQHYIRLSDVELEVSFPKPTVLKVPLLVDSLIAHRTEDPSWTNSEMYDISKKIWEHEFEEGIFTLLYGYLSEKVDSSYDVQSYLLIEPFLVKRKDIDEKEHLIIGRNYEWSNDLHASAGSLSKVYFGELYWADSIPELKPSQESIPLEEIEDKEIVVDFHDSWLTEKFKGKKPGDKVKVKHKKNLLIEVTSAVIEYSWESISKVYPSLRIHIPAPNIGKFLSLQSDPSNCRIIDNNGKLAFKTIDYEIEVNKQELNYIRTDLLQAYLVKTEQVLMYQIKQHTYDRITSDGNGDFRGMQFFFPHLSDNK